MNGGKRGDSDPTHSGYVGLTPQVYHTELCNALSLTLPAFFLTHFFMVSFMTFRVS